MNHFLLSVGAITGVLLSQTASAETQTANMASSASVSSVCSFSASALAFGQVATSGATPGTSTINVTCTGGSNYTVRLGNGLHNNNAQRRLQSSSNLLLYGLYKESAYTNRWGESGAEMVSGTGSGAQQALTVYGRIDAGQSLVSGVGTPYTDTILVTLEY